MRVIACQRQVVLAKTIIQLYPGERATRRWPRTHQHGRRLDRSCQTQQHDQYSGQCRAEDGKRSNVHVVVDSGQMTVRTEQQSEDNKNVVETPKTQNQIGGQTAASFGVNPEGTEEIRVNSGAVESANRIGERMTLQGGEYVSINQSGTLSKPQRLLDVPQPLQPRDLKRFSPQRRSASVALRWQNPFRRAVSHRVEVRLRFLCPGGKGDERDQV